MTSHKGAFEGHSVDELGRLLRWALYDSVGRVHPPAHVWERIERKVRRLAAVERARHQVTFDWRPIQPSLVRVGVSYLFVDNALRVW